MKYNQVLVAKHLVTELVESLHGKSNKHLGIFKMLKKIQQKYYYPGIETIVKNGFKVAKSA